MTDSRLSFLCREEAAKPQCFLIRITAASFVQYILLLILIDAVSVLYFSPNLFLSTCQKFACIIEVQARVYPRRIPHESSADLYLAIGVHVPE